MERNQVFQLSDRLLAIASHVLQGETVADIGTDHGYIPIWLLYYGITDKVILTDLKEGPLIKAGNNFRKWLPDIKPDLRQGAGLSVLKPGEADTILIAGMGGILISRIMSDHPEIVDSASRLVLQPRNHAFTLRKYLRGMENFITTEEQIVPEAGRYCEIITITRKDLASDKERLRSSQVADLEKQLGLDESIYDEVPLLYALTGRYRDYLEYKRRTEIQVIENILAHGRSEYADSRRKRAEYRMDAFGKLKDLQERILQEDG